MAFRILVLVACVELLIGCTQALRDNLKDGYQFGDLTDAEMKNLDKICGDDLGLSQRVARGAVRTAQQTVVPIDVCLTYEAFKNNESN